eukprot:937875-Prorocentrum_lima.AAC.1
MTSSLVGSEMCIRDSTTTLPKACSSSIRAGFPFSAASLVSFQHLQVLSNCLLYTSDAADDM